MGADSHLGDPVSGLDAESNEDGFQVGSRNVVNAINSASTANVIVPFNDPFGSMHTGGARRYPTGSVGSSRRAWT